ncbi:hypothetical protein CRE_13080 [Caenorhabditis remanei]|uniref:Uncharacterized protein n=1 Tax=Caenorhabditis remanei TaxID=31234 RepID=E3NBP1_CAERE|nr:hypothetical protein CRE_13080 [Caenorhabditis remanei]
MSTGINRSRTSSVSSELSFRERQTDMKSPPRLPSINFKSTQDAFRGAIAQSLDAASDALVELQNLRNVHQAGDLDGSLADSLRKTMKALLLMLDGDEYFLDKLDNVQLLLSEKERCALRKGVLDYLLRSPREDMVSGLRLGVTELETLLTLRGYPYLVKVTAIDLEDICKHISSPREDAKLAHGFQSTQLAQFSSRSESSDSNLDKTDTSIETKKNSVTNPDGIEAVPSATGDRRHSVYIPSAPSITEKNGSGCASSFPQVFGTTGVLPRVPRKIAQQVSSSVVPHVATSGQSLPPFPSKPEHIVCPVYYEGRETLEYESLQEVSPIKAIANQAGADVSGRLVPPRNPNNGVIYHPHDLPHTNFLSRSNAEQKMRTRSVVDTEDKVKIPRFRQSNLNDYEEEDERSYGSRKESRRSERNHSHLSFHELETVLPQFNADPLRYNRFAKCFESMVLLNPKLNDWLKYTLLEKKLVGKAKRFLADLNDPRDALEATLEDLQKAFAKSYSPINEALTRFQELTFHKTDFTRAERELLI